jgi:Ca2+-transporting ATPase
MPTAEGERAKPPPPHGLTEEEARQRLAAHGPNEWTDRERNNLARTVAGVVAEPMFLMLLIAAALYLTMGDLGCCWPALPSSRWAW